MLEDNEIISRFENHVKTNPDDIALVQNKNELTYSELLDLSKSISAYASEWLLAHGIKSQDERIGVLLPRSGDAVAAILAVLSMGSTFVPIDPDLPVNRIFSIIEQAEIKLILSTNAQTPIISKLQRRYLDDVLIISLDDVRSFSSSALEEAKISRQNEVSYIIFTSGSTGTPKGVCVGPAGLLNLVNEISSQLNVCSKSRVLQFASLSFDASVWEIFGAILNGATLCIPDYDSIMPSNLAKTIERYRLTHITLPPSVLLAVRPADFSSLEVVVSAGEPCNEQSIRHWFDCNWALYNAYGPTEATVCTHISKIVDLSIVNTLGKPIRKTFSYVMNDQLEPVEVGEKGELYLGGVGLAEKYLNDPEKTNRVFIKLQSGERVYKSGDCLRRLPSGLYEFIGRLDRQVKFRGFRIDLGEIDSVALRVGGVKSAYAMLKDVRSTAQLVLFYTSEDYVDLKQAIVNHFRKTLPKHMIPNVFLLLKELPLTANGKISSDSLAKKLDAINERSDSSSDSSDELAAGICAIFAEIVECTSVNLSDDFFEIGGHSLLLVQVLLQIEKKYKVVLSLAEFTHDPTPAGVMCLIKKKTCEESEPPALNEEELDLEAFPLSKIQQAYYLSRESAFNFGGKSTHLYHEYKLKYLKKERLEKALNALIKATPMLRCKIINESEQVVLDKIPDYKIQVSRIKNHLHEDDSDEFLALRNTLSTQSLRTDSPPLLHLQITEFDTFFIVHVLLDALIIDGFSSLLFFENLSLLYDNSENPCVRLNYTYQDYINNRKVSESSRSKAMKYWMSRIPNIPIGPSLPMVSSNETSGVTRSRRKVLDPVSWQRFTSVCKQARVSTTSMVFTLLCEVIARWSQNNEFTLMVTLFDRDPIHKEINKIIGVFTTLILLSYRGRALSGLSFIDKTREIQNGLYEAIDHRHYSGIEVQKKIIQESGCTPASNLFPIVFTSMLGGQKNSSPNQQALFSRDNISCSITQASRVFLDVKAIDDGNNAVIEWDFYEDVFPSKMIDEMFDLFCSLISHVMEPDPMQSFRRPPPCLAPRDSLCFSNGSTPATLQELLLMSVKLHPHNTAMIGELFGDLSYQSLLQLAESNKQIWSRSLIGRRPVALLVESSELQIVSILTLVLLGVPYLPISVDQPIYRINKILDNAKVKTVVCDNSLLNGDDWLGDLSFLSVSSDVEKNLSEVSEADYEKVDGSDLAYIIYTSGTTGTPKGVAIEHQSVINTLIDINNRFNVSETDRILALSSYSFDLSVYDIFGSIAAGSAIVTLKKEDKKNPESWCAAINDHSVTIWNSVPMMAKILSEFSRQNKICLPSTLRLFLLSGDWVPLNLPGELRQLFQSTDNCRVISLGGATECSIWSIFHEITSVEEGWSSIPYGRSLSGQNVAVVDDDFNVTPTHVVGDIVISGKGLAREYYNNASSTSDAFLTHSGVRWYKTGDQGAYDPEGRIIFLGRTDGQVKINGYRVELSEITAEIVLLASIKAAVSIFVKVDNSHNVIVSFYVPFIKDVKPDDLKAAISDRFPSYMIPSFFIKLDSIPLTSNNKIDYSALEEIATREISSKHIEEDRSSDTILSNIWRDILGVEEIFENSDFFLLGGDSIKLVVMLSRLKAIGYDVRLEKLMLNRVFSSFRNYLNTECAHG